MKYLDVNLTIWTELDGENIAFSINVTWNSWTYIDRHTHKRWTSLSFTTQKN